MSRLIAGRIGFSVNGGGSGGIFNFLTQYILKKQDFWEKINIVGGTESTPGNGYKYHFFTDSGPLVVYNGGSVDYIIVAGGGGGGDGNGGFTDTGGGGGGAGGCRTGTVRLFEGQYHIIIGSGGPRSPLVSPSTNIIGNGSPSLLRYIGNISEPESSASINIESTGGGAGGNYPSGRNGRSGGSGGGGGAGSLAGGAGSGNTPPTSPSQGNPGGTGIAFAAGGGGGSGGSGVGGSNPPAKGGNGGLGIAGFNADSGIPPSYGATGPSPGRWFAGGGGGSGFTTAGFGGVGPGAGPGPFAGGGPGGRPSTTAAIRNGTAGAVNTGGGGGGGAASPIGGDGGSGGSGIVIIRYLI